MVKMVFVHGVTVRKGPDYEPAVKDRDRRFREIAFRNQVDITNSYWGEFGAHPKWKLECIPDFASQYESLSLNLEERNDLILEAARQDFAAIVGSLSVAAIRDAEGSGDAEKLNSEEKFWAGAAAYVEALNGQPPAWLHQCQDDDDFFSRLRQEAEGQAQMQSLGLVDDLKETAGKLVGGLSNLVNSPFGKIGRDVLSPKIAHFVGDVFRYLKAKGPRDSIRKAIIADIAQASKAAKAQNDKLVLAGHSMGAVILYDILSDPQGVKDIEAASGVPLSVDLFLSVGSQVALFEELKVFEASDEAIAKPQTVALPPNVRRWWNVFDKMDVLSFLVEPVFQGAVDLKADTTAGVADAHGAYFHSMVFYQRLNKRLKVDGLIT